MSYIIKEEYRHLEPGTHFFSPHEWHGKYKLDCFKLFGFKCSVCFKKIKCSEGVVHHLTYKHKGGIYQAMPEQIKDKICLMCHNCHLKEHQSKSIDGTTKILRPTMVIEYCVDCGEGFDIKEHQLNNERRCEPCANTYTRIFFGYDIY
jgi:hypothetical protein